MLKHIWTRGCNPQALATTAAALVHMEAAPSREWGSAYLASCHVLWSGTPSALPPQSLALSAWASVRLNLQLSRASLAALMAAAEALGPRLGPQDVAQLLWALGALRRRETAPVTTAEALSTASRVPGSFASYPPHLPALLAAWGRCVGQMEAQQLSACLVGAAHLRLHVRTEAAQSTSTTQRVQAAEVTELLLRRTLHQLTWRLEHGRHDAQSSEQLGAARDAEPLAHSPSQVLSTALWAVARLGWRPPGEWMARAVEHFAAVAEDAGPQELANVWWALGSLRWAPPPDTAQVGSAGKTRRGGSHSVCCCLQPLVLLTVPAMCRRSS
jgi:hypothetical protein